MTILVFGKTGQVATELANAAPQARFLGRDEADLSNPDACAAAILTHAPDAVINAAAWTAVDKAEAEEPAATRVNADAPGAMARACADLGIPFVHISTDYVFSGDGDAPFAPDTPTGPHSAYGRSKLNGENQVRAAGGNHAILRTSWVFSSYGTNFVKTMLRLGAERDALSVVADQIGGPTSARAIALTCMTLVDRLQQDPTLGGTYHFAGTPNVSWADFAREIMRQAGLNCVIQDIPTSAYPTPATRPANSRLACESLTRIGLTQPEWRTDLRTHLNELGALK